MPRAPRLLPAPCLLAPELGCPPRARELVTEGNNSDKGLKIACNDGKHFVERSADKRGNRAVKKIGGEGRRGRSGADRDSLGKAGGAGSEPRDQQSPTDGQAPAAGLRSPSLVPSLKAGKRGERAVSFL